MLNTKQQQPKFALGDWVTLRTPVVKPFDKSGDDVFVGMITAINRTVSLGSRGAELLSYTVAVVQPTGVYDDLFLAEAQLEAYEQEEEETK